MNQVMYTTEEVNSKINEGKNLILAGDEKTLTELPRGNWIAGTIPYFMAENGGLFSRDKIYVTELPSYIKGIDIKAYTEKTVSNVYTDSPEQGLSIIIIPGTSPVHLSFALNAPNYTEFATRPLAGWISGVFLDEINSSSPKVFSGNNKIDNKNSAIVMNIELPETKYADIDIVNIFRAGKDDVITFPETGFSTSRAIINGNEINFAEYISEKKMDIRLPLVTDYHGVNVNTSFKAVDEEKKIVDFYLPVFSGLEYRHAAPVDDYIKEFTGQMPNENLSNIFFSCNCILNYLYSELEGKKTGGITGPITFGEIAYQLLNQTMVNLTINDY